MVLEAAVGVDSQNCTPSSMLTYYHFKNLIELKLERAFEIVNTNTSL